MMEVVEIIDPAYFSYFFTFSELGREKKKNKSLVLKPRRTPVDKPS